ncbi:MAG TPA: PIN domain-containing protein [Trueperaceae bacterium]|nr:PIN domain-containing protein [Trueperaceae bacterium]
MGRLLDTNVLLYSLSTASDERWKRDVAREILESSENVVSVQVLQEFYVQSTRATRKDPISHDLAVGLIRTWLRFPVQTVTIEVLGLALDLRAKHGWSYWDSAVVASALTAGCNTVLTEDLQHGQVVAGLTIVNPFRVEP